ncbi:hypothetical protein RVX_R10180 [Nitratidesulfovibrio sp. HK-II]|uniref:hypothetical protein n=1 Tax=Nitratidesulfovibrio sp. HK-II TaxID=2009266 RepID=UPI000E2F8F43|nr:hypothetical protein [Nitratidesulfovibrio sp. HK-II]GBO95306.1 hypothetical protein RVX_0347 [Nitratidesulfovibrio sp. HK-II]
MTRQVSFTRLEQAQLPGFRERLDRAESPDEVRRFFAETVATLLADALGAAEAVRYDAVALSPDAADGYALDGTIRALPGFAGIWTDSDLPRIVGDFARVAVKRYRHLVGNPERTEAKTRHKDGKR